MKLVQRFRWFEWAPGSCSGRVRTDSRLAAYWAATTETTIFEAQIGFGNQRGSAIPIRYVSLHRFKHFDNHFYLFDFTDYIWWKTGRLESQKVAFFSGLNRFGKAASRVRQPPLNTCFSINFTLGVTLNTWH